MLKTLQIRNYALIDEIDIQWQPGFSVITGETGAGKSIIIGALQLLTGLRADAKVLQKPEQKCIVEASFQCPEEIYQSLVEAYELEDLGQIILRREIFPNGKSRSFVNDSPKLLSELQLISNRLLHIHQQFDHLDFYDRSFQLEILDTYAGLQDQVQTYTAGYRHFMDLVRQKQALEKHLQTLQNEKDFVEFQFNELHTLDLKKGELKALEEELELATKSEDVRNYCLQIVETIQQDGGISDQLQQCLNNLKNIRINDVLKEVHQRFESLQSEFKDLARDLEHQADHTEYDPVRIQQIEQRLDLINRMLKKHRLLDDSELLQLQNTYEEKIRTWQGSDQSLDQLGKEIALVHKTLEEQALKLSKARLEASKELTKKTLQVLQQLGMEFSRFEIRIKEDEKLNESGLDLIEFLFSANKGSSLKSLKDQSSGGELARFNLAVKSLIAQKNSTSCLIFDEIDTGVSGQIALKMGTILKSMADHQQVISITHSPQVASRAVRHFYVYKEHHKDTTQTRIKILNEEERVHELAKMLSGEPPSKAAVKNAYELIHVLQD